MIIETQSSSNTQENDFSFGWHDSMVKDIMARRTSDNEVKESFVFSPIIINDVLAFFIIS